MAYEYMVNMEKMESEIKRERKVFGLALAIALIFPLALQIPTGIGESPPEYDHFKSYICR